MDKTLSWFVRIWVAFAVLMNAVAIAFFATANPDTNSPFNVIDFIMIELVLLSPAIGAYLWREYRRSLLQLDYEDDAVMPDAAHRFPNNEAVRMALQKLNEAVNQVKSLGSKQG